MAIKSRAKYTSRGERNSVNRSLINLIKASRPVYQMLLLKQTAWVNGHNPWITIENPDKNMTNKRYIRIRANNLWGLFKPKFTKKND